MAWLDDRIWCHGKFTDLSDGAFRTYCHSVAYSSGMGTRGVLTPGQQKTIGSSGRRRTELVNARLWDDLGAGTVRVHDWDDHNGKRDARKEADRERKRAAREAERSAGQSNGTSAGQSPGASTVPAHVDRVTVVTDDLKAEVLRTVSEAESRPGPIDRLLEVLQDADDNTKTTLSKLALELHLSEGDFEYARECATGPGVKSPVRVAVSALKKRSAERQAVA